MTNQSEKKYVVGFMFSKCLSLVALIVKKKSAWQHGLLNGIGGKVEPGETGRDAMVREFREETGADTTADQWLLVAGLSGMDREGAPFAVEVFATRGGPTMLSIKTDELVVIRDVKELHARHPGTLDNLPWLVALSVDCLRDGRPQFVTATYPGVAPGGRGDGAATESGNLERYKLLHAHCHELLAAFLAATGGKTSECDVPTLLRWSKDRIDRLSIIAGEEGI